MGLFKKIYTARQQGERVPAWVPRSAPAASPAGPPVAAPLTRGPAAEVPTPPPGDLRPLWLLYPGGMPVESSAKKKPTGEPTAFAREGDKAWRSIHEL